MEFFTKAIPVERVDSDLGLVLGWGIICTENGEPYYDSQGHHIPENEMLAAVTDFMKHRRYAKDMHTGEVVGSIVHSYPLTGEIAKSLCIATTKTGWLLAMSPSPGLLAKFKDKTYTGFSIGGEHGTLEPVIDE